MRLTRSRLILALTATGSLAVPVGFALAGGAATAAPTTTITGGSPVFSNAVAFDVSRPFSELATIPGPARDAETGDDVDPGDGPYVPDAGHTDDGALQSTTGSAAISGPITSFDGLSSLDNFNTFGFRVNPPDPNSAVGPNNIVETVNLNWAAYTKTGTKLVSASLGSLWAGFSLHDCTDESGDPVVMYDQVADRWILSQFTTPGPEFVNCIAVYTTADPTGASFRYASATRPNFRD